MKSEAGHFIHRRRQHYSSHRVIVLSQLAIYVHCTLTDGLLHLVQ